MLCLKGKRTEENVLKIRSQFIPYYDEHNADLSRPYPGISELLKTLQQQGIMIAVASNKYQAATRKLIAHYFPEINFVEVLGQREGIPAKSRSIHHKRNHDKSRSQTGRYTLCR